MAIEKNHEVFSPDAQRKVVSPIVAPSNLANLAGTFRGHVMDILNHLPREEVIEWVDSVSIKLTTRMLATLFDFPFEQRRKLTYWSEVASVDLKSGGEIDTEEKRIAALGECLISGNDTARNSMSGGLLARSLRWQPARRNACETSTVTTRLVPLPASH